jgi:polyisoprenoid-binding protein YceI
MKASVIVSAIATAVLVSAAGAYAGAGAGLGPNPIDDTTTYSVRPESRLWLEGNSTVRRYRCEATRFEAAIEAGAAKKSLEIADLQSSVRGVRLTVPVDQLNCGDGTMEGHLRRALNQPDHPVISYRLGSHKVSADAAGRATVALTGSLTINGQERPLTMEVEAIQEANGSLRVKGNQELKMTEFGVRPPRLMLGTLRVHDEVVVHFDILLAS